MKYNRIISLILVAMMSLSAMGQEKFDRNQLDTLMLDGEYATAYALVREHYRQVQGESGAEQLAAAFYLTALDYAYNKSPVDSALLRYHQLARRLQGIDRAVAYSFLFQAYRSVYENDYWRLKRNTVSDDPNLKYFRWHLGRMEDTLTACADSVLAYAEMLRHASPQPYRWLWDDRPPYPVMDSSLLGMLVQVLLVQSKTYHVNITTLTDSGLPYPLNVHHKVAPLYRDGTADMKLWLDLQRLDACYYNSAFLPLVDSLSRCYSARLQSVDMKALLNTHRAKYLNYEQRKLEAEQLCLETEQAYPGTYGARYCRQLRHDICLPDYKINYSSTESSRRSRMACVESRNVQWIDFRLVKQDLVPDSLRRMSRLDTLQKLPAVKEWRQAIPDPGDHLTHQYIIALPAVPQGEYYLVALTDSSFCHGVYQSVDATLITYDVAAAAGKHTRLYPSSGYLVDRLTGQPLVGKRITLHLMGGLSYRDYRRRCRTDREGYFHFPTSSFRYHMMEANDLSAQVDGYEYPLRFNSWRRSVGIESSIGGLKSKMLEIVMTDRPIYRLGDTVRFSCVAYRQKESGEAWETRLRPASNVKLAASFGMQYSSEGKDTLMLTTDKHGRCWGEFVIPADGRNGMYELEIEDPNRAYYYDYRDYRTVRVEAYKPPRFMVSLSTTAGDADTATATVRRFGQPITVYGTAMSYSGAPMTGAKVKWEVSRERMLSPMQSNSIADEYPYGDSLTVGDDGLFQFTFTPGKDSGTLIYTAYARVIDADGELREQQISFRVSDADGYCMVASDDLSRLSFVYNNFDHQPLKGAVRVELYQLQQPDTIRTLDPLMEEYPEAKWVGSRQTFYREFPFRAFSREEGDKHSWPVVAKRFDQTTDGRQLEVDGLPSGLYRVSFTTPDGGHHDTLVNYVARGGRVTGDDVVWVRTTPQKDWSYYPTLTCQVGDTARFELGSPYGNQPLYYTVSHAAKVYQRGMMVLDSSHTATLTIPITKKMADGCVVTLSAIREGRWFSQSYKVNVVRSDRMLKIATETFRDRLQPGQQEQWRFRITHADTTKSVKGVEANLCLSMYDLSLEQFGRHSDVFWPWSSRYREMRVDIGYLEKESLSGTWKGVRLYGLDLRYKPSFGFALPVISDYYNQLVLRFSPGSLKGTIVDAKTGELLPFVNVHLFRNGKSVAVTSTDFDGAFLIRNVPGGEYDLEVSSVGYRRFLRRIVVDGNMRQRFFKIPLSSAATSLECVEIVEDGVPVIEIGAPESGRRLTSDDIARMPGNSVESVVAIMQGNVRKRTGVNAPKSAIAEIPAMLQFGNSVGDADPVYMRKNMSTLAFFEPSLRSDKEGAVEVSFTMPDALTQWRLHGVAWTDAFQMGYLDRIVYTQKELMVQPLLPRFLRQGDTTEIRAKVSNLTDSAMEMLVALSVMDQSLPSQRLNVAAHSSAVATFRLAVEEGWRVAEYKIVARNVSAAHGHHSDGEQGRLPVLSNRERITRSRLLYVAGTTDPHQEKTAEVQFSVLYDSLSVAFTPNPRDYAVQALPHFKRHRMPGNLYLANSIYVNHLSSQLTPLTEKEQKRAYSRFKEDMHQLLQAQTSKGGWSWMPGGKTASRHITEAILQRLATCPSLASESYYKRHYLKALSSLDEALAAQYLADSGRSHPMHYAPLSTLYARSLYLDLKPLAQCDSTTQNAYDYYYRLCKMQSGDNIPLYRQGQLALLMLRMGDTADAVALAKRIKGSAHTDDTLGMYWVSNVSGYGWYQRPIETAALLVDVFADVLQDWESVSRIQQWILSSKQGTTWKTDMATAHAVAALVRQPSDTLRAGQATLTLNGQPIDEGYTDIDLQELPQPVVHLRLTNTSPYPAWGAVFVSREMPVDSIPYNGTDISLRKTLSRVDSDGSLHLLEAEPTLRVGDRIRVHIDIYCRRDMDNMVLSDQRAAAFEPVSTASGWCWNDGLRYYTDVRDERVDCYIDRLNEGHYYVEYDLLVRHAGTFANGIGSLHSVYAPEFRANTSSTKIRIVD